MKVKELIALLEKEDPEKRVIIDGYEGGFSDINNISLIKIKLNQNSEWYYGKHDRAYTDEPFDEEAVLI